MPGGAHKECRAVRCGNYAEPNGYCKLHQKAIDQRPAFLAKTTGLQTCAQFRRLRYSFLIRNPICNRCHAEPSRVLDHIVPHRGSLRLFWDQRNWQGLCLRCHGIKTAKELLGRP